MKKTGIIDHFEGDYIYVEIGEDTVKIPREGAPAMLAEGTVVIVEDGRIVTETNRAGGILGGITSGMPLIVRACIKPTPSIGMAQDTLNLRTGKVEPLSIHGRHDPCIVPRAIPVAEAAAALALMDLLR